MQTHIRNMYRSKTHYSKEIAKYFKIAGYFFLLPALIGLLSSLFLFSVGGYISLLVIIFGLVLLCGYISHCNHNLKQNTVIWLWIGTIIYNGVPLIFTFNAAISSKALYGGLFSFLIVLCLIWLVSFILALYALSWTIKTSKCDF